MPHAAHDDYGHIRGRGRQRARRRRDGLRRRGAARVRSAAASCEAGRRRASAQLQLRARQGGGGCRAADLECVVGGEAEGGRICRCLDALRAEKYGSSQDAPGAALSQSRHNAL